MEKIKVKQFNDYLVNDEVDVEFNDEILKVKKYLPLYEKMVIAKQIAMASFDEKTGAIDYNKVKILTCVNIIEKYLTNVNFPKNDKSPDVYKIYDVANSSGIDYAVYKTSSEDIHQLEEFIDNELCKLKVVYDNKNNARSVVNEVLDLFTSQKMLDFVERIKDVGDLKGNFEKGLIKDDEVDKP